MSDPFDLSGFEEAAGPAPFAAPMADYLEALNGDQRRAVEAIDGPVLVLAGAGTGKTRVLATRLVHILATGRAVPAQTLTVTFTNKAAREMKERVERLFGRSVEGWYLGTFHAIGARILRQHAELVGLTSSFTILDSDDQERLAKQVLVAQNIDDKRWPARTLVDIIQRWKDRGLTPERVGADHGSEFADGRALALYHDYQERLRALNAADFGDLLLHNLQIFQTTPAILEIYRRRFRFILVDEYQDTNVAQYLWLRLLAQGHRNICCVGDDDQSIYAWRGAEVGNILRFEHDFPGARVIRLERNYRSTGHILGAASGLIAHNQGRLGKTLWTAAGAGSKVRVHALWDGDAEARMVGAEIESLQRAGESLGSSAILVRASFQTRAFEERFIQIGMPYRVIGGLRFYERLEVRDAIAYLRVIAQPGDDLAFERIVNKPKRGIGEVSLQSVHRLALAKAVPLTHAAQLLIVSDELRGRARTALAALLDSLDRWRGLAGSRRLPELARLVLDESGYSAMWQADRSPDAPGRLENLKELVNALEDFASLEGFLEHVSLVMDNAGTAGADAVNLMTLHAAKGLEFDTVFLPGWEEGLFPNQRALDESGLKALEEERRLAHVGLTRARKRAFISFVANRFSFGQWLWPVPSRFLAELPEQHVERTSEVVNLAPHRQPAGMAEAAMDDAFDDRFAARPANGRRSRDWRRDAGRQLIEAEPLAIQTHDHAPGSFAPGMRVFHQKFGYGRVEAVEGNKLSITFEKAGTKKIIDSFVAPT